MTPTVRALRQPRLSSYSLHPSIDRFCDTVDVGNTQQKNTTHIFPEITLYSPFRTWSSPTVSHILTISHLLNTAHFSLKEMMTYLFRSRLLKHSNIRKERIWRQWHYGHDPGKLLHPLKVSGNRMTSRWYVFDRFRDTAGVNLRYTHSSL